MPLHVHEVATRARDAATRRVGEAAGQAQQAEARLSTSQRRSPTRWSGSSGSSSGSDVQLATRTDPNPTTVCPFRGLQAFGSDDAQWFFGRERLVAEVVARLVTRPVLCLVGASGSGKSSVLAGRCRPGPGRRGAPRQRVVAGGRGDAGVDLGGRAPGSDR